MQVRRYRAFGPRLRDLSPYLLLAAVLVSSPLQGQASLSGTAAVFRDRYDNYLSRYQGVQRPEREYLLRAVDCSLLRGEHRILEGFEGLDHPVLYSGESGEVTWRIDVQSPGLYNIRIRYYAVAGKSAPVERELLINGKRPFFEARSVVLRRNWQDRSPVGRRDNRGNDIRPVQIERPEWQETVLRDLEGYYAEPYLFFLAGGVQTLTLRSVREPIVVDFLLVGGVRTLPTYDQAVQRYQEQGYGAVRGVRVKVQAEQALSKSDPSLYPVYDRSSPATEPNHIYQLRLNTIGGTNWRYPGQRITWVVDLPEAGLYRLVLKVRQNQVRGIHSSRTLYINDEVPFEEVRNLSFPFKRSWQIMPLGGQQPFLFYFHRGRNTVTLEVSLVELSETIKDLETSVFRLNELYRQIVMITGTVPDPFRDYQLEQRITGLVQRLEQQRLLINEKILLLEQLTGQRGGTTAALQRVVRQIADMIRKPESIPERLEAFKINIGALGAWLFDVRQLPLEMDYFLVQSVDQPLPRAEAGFLRRLAYGAAAFAASFFVDYNTIGDVTGKDALEVWLVGGRQQAQIMKTLVDESFSQQEGISVNLKIVDQQIVLPSILSGRGPDVISNLRRAQPVDFALRNSVQALSEFPDFQEVRRRFHPSAVLPFQWQGKTYALPETQLFQVMFYREDVLAELGVELPQTWSEVYQVIPALQKHNLDFGLPITLYTGADLNVQPINPAYAMLLFQHGGAFYSTDGRRSALDSEEAIRAFAGWTELYTNFKLPIDYALRQRFRTGEMPIGISYFNFYNVLTVFAPELRGLWSFTSVPGVVGPDGGIRKDVSSEVTAAVILKDSGKKEEAWKFLRWWTGKEVQEAFGRDMESILGPAARYPTANQEALVSLAWPVEVIRSLQQQWDDVHGIPEVPGGYFTGRHLENAFRNVVFQGDIPREVILDYAEVINEEILIKRREFGLE